VAFAAIESSDQFGARWKAWAKRLEIRAPSAMTVLADGAKWIREEARLNLPGSMGVLDLCHALEAISDTSKKLFSEGTSQAQSWTDKLRTTILEQGWTGFEERWEETRATFPAGTPQPAHLEELRNDPGNHVSHLNDAERLQQGRSIGSGKIERDCKNLIGRFLKQTAAKWRIRRLNRMAGLGSVMYSRQWNACWTTQNA
jgi:hypothetical protein